MAKTVRISDEAYEQAKWLVKQEDRYFHTIVERSIFAYLGDRHSKYVKDKNKKEN